MAAARAAGDAGILGPVGATAATARLGASVPERYATVVGIGELIFRVHVLRIGRDTNELEGARRNRRAWWCLVLGT